MHARLSNGLGAALICVAFSLVTPRLAAQDGQPAGAPPGLNRETMWYAPTDEDWQKPCLVTWQRTWEDALAVSRETGKAILICVNMDGEIASEHYAGVRYRQPEIAKLYEPYVTVMASIYRHTPRDHDENGERIPCPRFGTVTCGEHIAIEPVLYERFFEGKRIAPRHIMVELDGTESYDVYYAWDTDSVFEKIRDGIASRAQQPPPVARGDRPVIERVASPDVVDRMAVEQAFREGDEAIRRRLVEAAVQAGGKAPVELLRQALNATDPDLVARAREALAMAESEQAVDLISEEMRQPIGERQREAFVAALKRLGEGSYKARTLAVVHGGLEDGASGIDAAAWAELIGGGESYAADVPAPSWEDPGTLDAAHPNRRVTIAEANLEDALRRRHEEGLTSDPLTTRALLIEARELARTAMLRARDGDVDDFEAWRAAAVEAVASWELGETDEALARAEDAVKGMPAHPESWSSMMVLGLFAERRREQIREAVLAKRDWPGSWLADLDAAYGVLARHPLGTVEQAVAHYDMLDWLAAEARARAALEHALERFPDSAALHERFRTRVFRERGIRAVEDAYARLLAQEGAAPALHGHAGYATHVVAEFHRRARRFDQALAAYDRALAHYRALAEALPEAADNAAHFASIVLAGQAKIALERGELATAVERTLAAFARSPASAATPDGLNISAVDTAKMIQARLQKQPDAELSKRLDEAMKALDPALLALPAYERAGAGQGPPDDARPGRGRGQGGGRGEGGGGGGRGR